MEIPLSVFLLDCVRDVEIPLSVLLVDCVRDVEIDMTTAVDWALKPNYLSIPLRLARRLCQRCGDSPLRLAL